MKLKDSTLDKWEKETTTTIEGEKLNIFDLARFFVTSRGFPTILKIGSLMGEGQSGGRYISDIAKELEAHIINLYGKTKYVEVMDAIIKGEYW